MRSEVCCVKYTCKIALHLYLPTPALNTRLATEFCHAAFLRHTCASTQAAYPKTWLRCIHYWHYITVLIRRYAAEWVYVASKWIQKQPSSILLQPYRSALHCIALSITIHSGRRNPDSSINQTAENYMISMRDPSISTEVDFTSHVNELKHKFL